MRFRLLVSFIAVALGAFAHAAEYVALIGTYTGGESRGIYAVKINPDTGIISPPTLAAELRDPEFMALHPNGRFVYALTRVRAADGKTVGAVAAYAIEGTTLKPLNVVPTNRDSLTHLAVDATGRMIVAASYGGGYVVSFPVKPNGWIGAATTFLTETGPLGPNHARQEAPHPHSVTLAPDNRYAFVSDLGVDRVFSYRLDPDHATISPNDPGFALIASGAGPRHSKFSIDGKSFYVVCELGSLITACRYAGRGTIEPFQRISTLPDGFAGKNGASEIRVHPNGHFVYAANRGHNSIAVFARDAESGALTRVEVVPCGGETPRNFGLTPDGKLLLCANQASNTLTVFRVDSDTGRLTALPSSVRVPTPVCVLFLR